MAKICFCGRLADALVQKREIPVPVQQEGCTLGELRALITRLEPAAASSILRPGFRGPIDDGFVGDDAIVRAGQRVELMSPLSGS